MNLRKINTLKIFLICSVLFSLSNCQYSNIISEKWVVVTSINAPTDSIKKLTELPEPWKIVVIGDKKSKNEEWNIYINSNKLVYLSVQSQLKLNYKVLKYIPYNSYTRKNIGYLFAIQHGAKEIYETDDDNIFTSFDQLNKDFNNIKISYAENNINSMVNPYAYFGRPSIWPRGFSQMLTPFSDLLGLMLFILYV